MWPFKSKPNPQKETRDWLRQQIADGVPIGEIYHTLIYRSPEFMLQSLEFMQERSRVESELGDILVNRNNEGRELEKQGKVDEAINLYEANAADGVDMPFPYDRLRIIYTKRKDYQNAIRVCEAHLETSRKYYPESDTSKLEEQIAKLREKATKETI